jgi:hypothetical protein
MGLIASAGSTVGTAVGATVAGASVGTTTGAGVVATAPPQAANTTAVTISKPTKTSNFLSVISYYSPYDNFTRKLMLISSIFLSATSRTGFKTI